MLKATTAVIINNNVSIFVFLCYMCSWVAVCQILLRWAQLVKV